MGATAGEGGKGCAVGSSKPALFLIFHSSRAPRFSMDHDLPPARIKLCRPGFCQGSPGAGPSMFVVLRPSPFPQILGVT